MDTLNDIIIGLKWGKLEPIEAHDRVLALFSVSNRSKTKRVPSYGVFFRCDNCGHEPQMKSDTDNLLKMNYCPKCGDEFE